MGGDRRGDSCGAWLSDASNSRGLNKRCAPITLAHDQPQGGWYCPGQPAQGVFARLALTPVSLALLVFGTALAQVAMGLVQGLSVLLLGALLGMAIPWQALVLILGVATLAAATFVAFRALIAALTGRQDVADDVYFGTLLPLCFLSSFPPAMLPAAATVVVPWLPTSMAVELIGSLVLAGRLPDSALCSSLGLLLYAALETWRFRWEA